MANISEGRKNFTTAKNIIFDFNTTQLRYFFRKFDYDHLVKMKIQLEKAMTDATEKEITATQIMIDKYQEKINRLMFERGDDEQTESTEAESVEAG